MKIIIACGGTGGHLFPGLAVAEALRERGHEILLLVSEKEIDALALRGHDFAFERIASMGMPRMLSTAMLGFSLRFLGGLRQCKAIYNRFRPDAVLGMGGFTSTAPALAGRLASVPVLIHESNAIPGKANKINARFANTVLLGFKECAAYFPRSETRVTGTPIRSSMRAPANKSAVLEKFDFDPARQTLLIMGGSQGAHGLNEAVVCAIPALQSLNVQILHLAGGYDEPMVSEAYRSAGITARVSAFHHDMRELYAVADLAVARSGAASLSELCYFGLPSILIPFPHAADDHQTRNGEIMVRAGASEMLAECDSVGNQLQTLLSVLLPDAARLERMSSAARSLAPEHAAEQVADAIESYKK